MTGPKIGTATAGSVTVAISRPSDRPPAAWTSSVPNTGISSPPPMPCTTRKAISESIFHASPDAIEPARNSPRDDIQVTLPPNLASAHLLSGITMPKASRYPVSIHWTWASGACKPAPILSRATLTTVVSISAAIAPTSRTAASRTTAGSSFRRFCQFQRPSCIRYYTVQFTFVNYTV
jgi:hypothetical protein